MRGKCNGHKEKHWAKGGAIEVSLLSWEVHLKRSTCIWVTVLVAVVFGLVFLLTINGDAQKIVFEKTELAVTAIAESDETKWQELLHSEKGTHLTDLGSYKEELKSNGVWIDKSWRINGNADYSEETIDGEHAVWITQKIISGHGHIYDVSALYLFGDDAEGFVAFEIHKPRIKG